MKLGRTYDEEDFEESITGVGLHSGQMQREIEYETTLDEAQSKTDKCNERTLPSLSL
jgi:hypothetical protein